MNIIHPNMNIAPSIVAKSPLRLSGIYKYSGDMEHPCSLESKTVCTQNSDCGAGIKCGFMVNQQKVIRSARVQEYMTDMKQLQFWSSDNNKYTCNNFLFPTPTELRLKDPAKTFEDYVVDI